MPATHARNAPPAPRIDPVLAFLRRLWTLEHSLQSRSKRMESDIGVTGPQRLVLRLIGERPGISASELADFVCVHRSTITGILQRLERSNLIRRVGDPEDGRRALTTLTAAGQRVYRHRAGTVEADVRRALAEMPTRHRRALEAGIDALIRALG